MAILKCKMCGGTLEVNNETVAICDYCGTQQTLPKINDEVVANLFNRANNLRVKAEFDKAAQIYEKIIEQNGNESEAYWGLILCKYGIEYVEDPKTLCRIPTCHRTMYEAVTADADYLYAIENADTVQRAIYESEARAIDEIQKNTLAIVEKEEPFDVFICYKETDESGARTHDSAIANDIYHQLKQEGLKVFYAAITLEDKLGREYEPYIFAALNSAKVMLAIGTKPEYFNAVWVKNEWSRFLNLMKNDRAKLLIPCYRDMDAYDMPEEFAHLQAQDMSKIGFINDVVRGIKKVVLPEIKEAPVVQQTQVIENASGNLNALLERGFMALEDGEWQRADDFFEQVLNFDAKFAEAYLGKLMAELRVKTREDLKNCEKPFDDRNNYQKVMRFGDDKVKRELESFNECIRERIEAEIIRRQKAEEEREIARKESRYREGISLMDMGEIKQYKDAIRVFEEISGYKDSDALKEKCIARIEEMEKEANYIKAERCFREDSLTSYYEAARIFEEISGYKDSDALKEKCIARIEEMEKEINYIKAGRCLREGSLISCYEAARIFEEISGYKDSADLLRECNEKIELLQERASERMRQSKQRFEQQQEQQKSQYRNAGLCQHCGGSFKGLFSKVCTQCGRKKDY